MKKPTPSQRRLLQRLAGYGCWIVWCPAHPGACPEAAWWRGVGEDGKRCKDSLSPTIHLASLRALRRNGWIRTMHEGETWDWTLTDAGLRALNHNPSGCHACAPLHPVANL